MDTDRINIRDLLNIRDKNIKFIIPNYQREYSWEIDQCKQLWDDIEDFHLNYSAENNRGYFLGAIVIDKRGNTRLEVVDGQQRITSFLLLLRAIYQKLETMNETTEILGLKNQIKLCIWKVNAITEDILKKENIHLESEVILENDNKYFLSVMSDGIVDIGIKRRNIKNKYQENYLYFYKEYDRYVGNQPNNWQNICLTILDRCFVLKVECQGEDEDALTIFNTLNNRGLPLLDADIFKSYMYRSIETEEKKEEFIEKWNEILEIVENSKNSFSLNDLFTFYMHYLRGEKKIIEKVPALRKFYERFGNNNNNNYSILSDTDKVMSAIKKLADFWNGIYIKEITEESRRYLHCLHYYPNAYWKYITSVFYLKNYENFSVDNFEKFLQKLLVFLYSNYIKTGRGSTIQTNIIKNCASIFHNTEKPLFNIEQDINKFNFNEDFKKEELLVNICNKTGTHAKIFRKGLLLLHAYLNENQQELIVGDFHTEHILPKKWQNTNYNGWNEKDAKEYLEKVWK